MAKYSPKVHPMPDLEAPPPTPSMPPGSSTLEKGRPMRQQNQPFQPIPQVIQSRSPNARNCICKCIAYTVGLLLLPLDTLACTTPILYLVFQPKIPSYSIDKITINNLALNLDSTHCAKFNVKITPNNPNKKIGIYYEKGGMISALYTNTKLCQGLMPIFYQGHQNITKLDLSLMGQPHSGSKLMSAFQEQRQIGEAPLDLKIDAPVAIKLQRFKLKKVRILADCDIRVDSLSDNMDVGITTSN